MNVEKEAQGYIKQQMIHFWTSNRILGLITVHLATRVSKQNLLPYTSINLRHNLTQYSERVLTNDSRYDFASRF